MIKKSLFIAAITLCGFLRASAEVINVEGPVLAFEGSASMEIVLTNERTDLVSFQMDLLLPEGVSIDKSKCLLSSRISDKEQKLAVGRLESGAYRMTSTSLSLTPFSGLDGALLTIGLTSSEDFVNGVATISNILFSTSESERIQIDDVKFAINTQYTLTYKVDDEEYKTSVITYGSVLTPEVEPTKEGYTFSGWSDIPETMPAQDVEVTGSFTVNSYSLIYNVDGEEYKATTTTFGSELTPEVEPTKEGYTFSGWSEIPEEMPAHDVVVTGTFTINTYKLTYILDGEVIKSQEVEYGADIAAEVEPIKEGYTFSGWSEIPEEMPANDVTITGSFTVNSYKVTFKYGNELLSTADVEFGTSIPLPESLNSERYNLVEWLDVPETMPAHDIVIQASYTDGINFIENDQHAKDYYMQNGIKLSKPQRGLNIIRSSDGTIRKVMVR